MQKHDKESTYWISLKTPTLIFVQLFLTTKTEFRLLLSSRYYEKVGPANTAFLLA